MAVLRFSILIGSLLAVAASAMAMSIQGDVSAPAPLPTIDLTRHQGVIVEGDAGSRGSLSVACARGSVVGGGFSHVGKDLQVIESRPDGAYAWQVSWVQSSDSDSVVYVYASCLIPA